MCHKFPDCQHAGPVVEPVPDLLQHCRSTEPNEQCPYIKLGCLGCTRRAGWDVAVEIAHLLVLAQIERMKKTDVETEPLVNDQTTETKKEGTR